MRIRSMQRQHMMRAIKEEHRLDVLKRENRNVPVRPRPAQLFRMYWHMLQNPHRFDWAPQPSRWERFVAWLKKVFRVHAE